jgi:hypothetical protein
MVSRYVAALAVLCGLKKEQMFRNTARNIIFAVATVSFAACFAIDGTSINGFAVSCAWREGNLNWGPAPGAPESDGFYFRGALVKYEIRNNVAAADTLIKRTTCLVNSGGISINLEGTKIAFYRWKYYLDNTGGMKSTGQSYISVINRNGDSLRNLVAINDPPESDISAMDWPAGPWIYYLNPKPGTNPWDHRTRTVCRVNVNTGAHDSITTFTITSSDIGGGTVPTDWYVRRFSMTLDGTKVCLQNDGLAGSQVFCFPPSGGRVYSCPVFLFGACNGSVSASGLYTLSYQGWHNIIVFSSPLPNLPGPSSIQTETTVTDWAGGAPVCPAKPAGAPSGCNSCGGEWMHWSVNSDKWSSHWLGTCGHADGLNNGTNYVLINWIDKKAVMSPYS